MALLLLSHTMLYCLLSMSYNVHAYQTSTDSHHLMNTIILLVHSDWLTRQLVVTNRYSPHKQRMLQCESNGALPRVKVKVGVKARLSFVPLYDGRSGELVQVHGVIVSCE